jgi:lipopolysaccharide biosynthesis glycosyltransferase
MNWYMGYDRREDVVYQVARLSLLNTPGVHIIPLVQDSLRAHRIYTREDDRRAATDFSLTRFLVPYLELGSEHQWAIFSDCDFLFTRDLTSLMNDFLNPDYAVMVVKHDYTPRTNTKMGGVMQFRYPRKNWSSFIAWNLKHESNKALDVDVVNAAEPSWLHQFQWLDDSEIGDLPVDFNFLVGEYEPLEDSEKVVKPTSKTPSCLHYTLGIGPYVPPVKDYAALWEDNRKRLMSGKLESAEPMRSVQ